MHYVQGMELWTREVCSRDPEQVQDVDCKAMTTPMASNLKLLSDASSDSVDAMMYCQTFCSLMFLTYPRHAHLVAQHAVRYLKGIIEHDTNKNTNLHGYVDFDWEGSAIDRKSTLG